MKKLFFALVAVLVSSCIQGQTQSDFYGTWVQDNEGSRMEYLITSTIFTSTYSRPPVTFLSPAQQNTFEIFSWEKITNEDTSTKGDYPAGYLIGLRHGLGNTTARLFMHRNKNSLVSIYEYNNAIQREIYIKKSSGGLLSLQGATDQNTVHSTSPSSENVNANNENKFFYLSNLLDTDSYGYHEAIAMISGSKLQFSIRPITNDAKWTLMPQIDFVLPRECDYVFCLNDYEENFICVIINNTFHIYRFDNTVNKWIETPENFPLPKKHEQIIFISGNLGIVEKERIIFFEGTEYGDWEEIPEMAFILPSGYKYVSPSGPYEIAVLTANNNVIFFHHIEEWKEDHAKSLLLPNNVKSILGIHGHRIGAVYDNHIQFYYFIGNRWEIANEQRFVFSP